MHLPAVLFSGCLCVCVPSVLSTLTALGVDYKSKHCLTRGTFNISVVVTVIEQELMQIRKGSGFVYACANILYRCVKTEGSM